MNKKILGLLIIALVGFTVFFPFLALAEDPNCESVGNELTVCCIVDSLKDALLPIGILIIIIAWIVVGILYLTAAGSQTQLGVAKKALMAAVIGTVLVIVAADAYDIINSVLGTEGDNGGCPAVQKNK